TQVGNGQLADDRWGEVDHGFPSANPDDAADQHFVTEADFDGLTVDASPPIHQDTRKDDRFGGGVGYEANFADDGVHALPSCLPVENRLGHSDGKQGRLMEDLLLSREDKNAAARLGIDLQQPNAAVGIDAHIQPQLQETSVVAFDVRGNDCRQPANFFHDVAYLIPLKVAK